ncbi:hypothetical protein V6U81_10605 [Micromonospora sp. CPCC 205711]|uniref:hypothetical protein n=1 Tax=Micromonospora sp. CPCC 205547 TaxID=3122400 RepID=UPI002FF2BB78
MSIVALSPATNRIEWSPEQIRTEQHEWGVAVNTTADRACSHGRTIQRWINDQRSKGWGRVMEFHSLRVKVAWRAFDELPRHNDRRWEVVDGFLCDVLNDPNNGLVVVRVDKCGTCE